MAPVSVSRAETVIKRKRIPEIDFWRGFALIVILIDHVPWNGLDFLTPRNFGFSDAAEAFVFLSGVSVSLAYGPTLSKAGFGRLVGRCASRAGKLYLVQLAIVACTVAIPLAAATMVGDQDIELGQGVSQFVESPVSSIVSTAAFAYMPRYSGILALYVVLMLWAPVVLFLTSRRPALALLASVAVYVAGRGRVFNDGDGWTFNPFTWQLLFAIGIVCASKWRHGLPRPKRPLFALALAILVGAAVLSIKAMGLKATGLAYLDLDKHDLGVMRIAHFLALAYVVSAFAIVQPWTTYMSRIVSSRMGQSFQGMGRSSLLFFALGSVASTGGRSLMAPARSLGAPRLSVHVIGLIYTATVVVGMFGLVNRMNRAANRPRLSTESRNAALPMNTLGAEAAESAAFP